MRNTPSCDRGAGTRSSANKRSEIAGDRGDRGDRGDFARHTRDSAGRREGDKGRFSGDSGRATDEELAAVMNIATAKLSAGASFTPPDYPIDALGPLAPACSAIAEGGQMQPAMAGQSLVSTAALLTQSQANVKTLQGVKPLSLYELTIGESGDGKSTGGGCNARPCRRIQRKASDLYRVEVSRAEAARQTRKKGDPAPELPREPYIKMRDGTVEGIRRAFRQGVPSQGVFSSEAAMMLAGYGMNADNRAKSAGNFNSLWDNGEISVARGLDGRVQLYDRRLSLHWLIQPQVTRAALHDPLLSAIGFWPRFLLAWPPLSEPQTARGFHPETDSRITAYWGRCRELLCVPQGEDCRELPLIEADAAALELIGRYFERMQTAKLPDSLLAPVRAFALRSTELAFRIAGVLAAFSGSKSIDADAARNAIALAEYSLETWRGVFGNRDEADTQAAALQYLRWLLRQPDASASEHSMLHIGPKPRVRGRRDAALATLEQAEAREPSATCGRRARSRWPNEHRIRPGRRSARHSRSVA